MNDLQAVEALKSCLNQYLTETAKIESKYQADLSRLQSTQREIEKQDHSVPFLAEYKKVYEVCKRLYTKIEAELSRTHGIQYHIADILATAKVRRGLNETHTTDGWVEKIKEDCAKAVREINTAGSVEAFEAPIRLFCQAMADIDFICDGNNANLLLKQCGLYQKALQEATADVKAKINALEESHAKALQQENLPCYPQMQATKKKLEQALAGADKYLLQNGDIAFGSGYADKVLMGIADVKSITKEMADFALAHLSLDISPLHHAPVFFPLDNRHSSVIMELSPDQMADRKTSSYLEELLFGFLSALPCKKLSVAAIECPNEASVSIGTTLAPVMRRLEDKLGKNPFVYAPVAKTPEDAQKIIDDLFRECGERVEEYEANYYSDIYEYNRAVPDNQHEFRLLFVNNYPFGFASATMVNRLKTLMKDCTAGVLVVVLQSNSPADYMQRTDEFGRKFAYRRLSAEECGSDVITDVDIAKGTLCYNGKQISRTVTVKGFDAMQYWADLAEGSKKANVLYLDRMLEQITAKGLAYTARDSKLRIPMGQKDGDFFDFVTDIKNAPSAIILGASGSGKSSFIHTLLLSAAYLYSPKELEFYLTDFKSSEASTEFGIYAEGEKLYLPHVRYLSLKSTAENAFDLLDMIEDLHNKRHKLIVSRGVGDAASYNNLPDVVNGQTPPISRVLFFIDEFLTFLNGGASAGNNIATGNAIMSRLESQLTRVRSSGICIVLCGQYLGGLDKNALRQFGTRVGLNGYSENMLQFTPDEIYLRSDIQKKLTQKGMTVISGDGGIEKNVVRFAFAGDTGSKRQVELAEKIRAKYSQTEMPSQIVAGSTAFVPVTTDTGLTQRILEDAEQDKTAYSLYMGQTSSSSAPVALRLSTDTTSMGYYACAEGSERLALIERNILLGFLQTTALRKEQYTLPRITYCWIRSGSGDDRGNCLKNEMAMYPALQRHIDYVDRKYDCGSAIMKLYRLFKARRSGDTSVDRTPRLLLVHNPEWISTAGWAKAKDVPKADSTKRAKEQETLGLQLDKMQSGAADSMSAALGALAGFMSVKTTPDTPQKEEIPFSESEVKNALKDLYNNGHRENIFVVITTEIMSLLDDYFHACNRQADALLFGITDAFDRNSAGQKYPISCCHVKSRRKPAGDDSGEKQDTMVAVNSKTRLYDYNSNTQKAWWEQLMGLLQ